MLMPTWKYKPSRAVSFRFLLDIIVWSAVGIPVIVLFNEGKPIEVGFFCDDTSLKYPYRKSTISNEVLMGTSLGGAVSMMILAEFLIYLDKRSRTTTSWPIAHVMKHVGLFLFGFTINQLFILVLKQRVGRLRPHFFDVCKPDFNAINCSQGYITEYTCMNKFEREVTESRLSFPSGHASIAMYCAVYIGYYIQVHMCVTYSCVLKPVLQSVLVLLAVLNGMTRITDHKHHPTDVIAGYFIGAATASFVFGTVGVKIQKTSTVTSDQKVSETYNATLETTRMSLKKKYLYVGEVSCDTSISVLEEGNGKDTAMEFV
ncbi:hypothetical protein ACJMK2_041146 [Sinanodonta woodiana]|uniref:Phosphatidic acid phosphatase type 2/haloperoxidase domain-containing protein n=1 Tax=Sinanodonta woodiana TaxID=1069815 RepID=A0ABD3W366_SINWO